MGRPKDTKQLRDAVKAEAAVLIQSIPDPGVPVRERIARAAELLGWKYGRAEDIWRRQANRIEVWEMDQLRNLKAK